MQVQKPKQGYKLVRWLFGKEIEIPEKWEIQRLENLVNILDSKRIPIEGTEREQRHGKYPYYGASGIIDYIDDYIFDEKLLCLAEDGENLRSKVLPLAFTIEGKTWVNNHAHVLQAKETTEHYFLEYFLNHLSFLKYVASTAQPKLNQKDMRSITIICPSKSEQQKIASILLNVDSLIQQTKKEIEQTQKLKKSLMQKLFTKGTGNSKFKQVTLGSIITLQRGHDLPNHIRKIGSIPVIGSNGIVGYHDEYKAKGSGVIIGRSGTLGKVYFAENDYWPLNTSLYVKEFHSAYPRFVYYLLQTINYEKFNAGTSVPTLNRNHLHPIKISIPDNILEQQKIASILLNVDFNIDKHQEYKFSLENLKKGLMQKLLTGQIRVKV